MKIKRELFRPEPKLPAAAYKTYQAIKPRKTHFRPATCAEVDCPNRARGWRTVVDVTTALGQKQANYIRLHSGRHFTAEQVGDDLVTFTFAPGQTCFSAHRVDLEREPIFRIKGGDFRGNPLGTPTVTLRPQDWLDNFGEHQELLAARQQKG